MKHLTRLFKKLMFVTMASLMVIPYSFAQTPTDDVILSDVTETYRLYKDGDSIKVRNNIERTYNLNCNKEVTIYPSTFINCYITIDKLNSTCPGYKAMKIENATKDYIFHDDEKSAYFTYNLTPKKRVCKVQFQKDITSIYHFSTIVLSERYFAKHMTVKIIIPQDIKGFSMINRNFGNNISVKAEKEGNDSVYTYEAVNVTGFKNESNIPDYTLSKPYIYIKGAFKDIGELHRYLHKISDVDCTIPNIESVIAEITKGCKNDMEKISATYNYVQTNIRYVAIEDGINGLRPDTPAEVMRKKYGDCKGMSLLLITLLKAQGFDARDTSVSSEEGTVSVKENPSLGAFNHSICTLLYKGKYYFLDPTAGYLSPEYIIKTIQGKDALVENGEEYKIITIPTLPDRTSIDSIHYSYRLDREKMTLVPSNEDNAVYTLRGDMKVAFMSKYDMTSKDLQQQMLKNYLGDDFQKNKVENARWTKTANGENDAVIKGKVVNNHAVHETDGDIYIEMTPDNYFCDEIIDTTKRVNGYMLQFCHTVRTTDILLPEGSKVTFLPENLEITTKEGNRLSCKYENNGNILTCKQTMIINKRYIKLEDIPAWNEAIKKWKEACNNLIMVK